MGWLFVKERDPRRAETVLRRLVLSHCHCLVEDVVKLLALEHGRDFLVLFVEHLASVVLLN